MTKLVMYRNNTAYEQFLAPALKDREGFKMQVFPQGTPKADITAWIAEHVDYVRGMEKIIMDITCFYAGTDMQRDGRFWRDVKIDFVNFDLDRFLRCSLQSMVEKATAEEAIAEMIRLFLQKETPAKVFVVTSKMGDHSIFGRDTDDVAAEKLRVCLSSVIGLPVYEYTDYKKALEEDAVTWLFFDRHYGYVSAQEFARMPATWRRFTLPIDNLVLDACDFGVGVDLEAYSQTIREKVSTW